MWYKLLFCFVFIMTCLVGTLFIFWHWIRLKKAHIKFRTFKKVAHKSTTECLNLIDTFINLQ